MSPGRKDVVVICLSLEITLNNSISHNTFNMPFLHLLVMSLSGFVTGSLNKQTSTDFNVFSRHNSKYCMLQYL